MQSWCVMSVHTKISFIPEELVVGKYRSGTVNSKSFVGKVLL